MRIVYCVNTLHYAVGAEIITIIKANALARVPGNHVWIIETEDQQVPVIPLEGVERVNLHVNYYQGDGGGYVKAVMATLRKSKIHRKRLEAALNDIQPDVVISTGRFEKDFLPLLKVSSRPVFIRELHTARDYKLRNARTALTRLLGQFCLSREYRCIVKHYDKIVVLTPSDKTGSWAHWDKVAVIPNPLTCEPKTLSEGTAKVAITAGRLAHIKNIPSLINIWARVVEQHPDWTLQIWGKGEEQQQLEAKIAEMGLEGKVCLMGHTSDVLEKMSSASLFLLTSLSEGFSLATLEAMAVGIPSVVYDSGGISYLVENGKTGYLVPMNNEEVFAKHVCYLIEHEEKRRAMGHAAMAEVSSYSTEHIASLWMSMFQTLYRQKHSA